MPTERPLHNPQRELILSFRSQNDFCTLSNGLVVQFEWKMLDWRNFSSAENVEIEM